MKSGDINFQMDGLDCFRIGLKRLKVDRRKEEERKGQKGRCHLTEYTLLSFHFNLNFFSAFSTNPSNSSRNSPSGRLRMPALRITTDNEDEHRSKSSDGCSSAVRSMPRYGFLPIRLTRGGRQVLESH